MIGTHRAGWGQRLMQFGKKMTDGFTMNKGPWTPLKIEKGKAKSSVHGDIQIWEHSAGILSHQGNHTPLFSQFVKTVERLHHLLEAVERTGVFIQIYQKSKLINICGQSIDTHT